ncbi:beta-ketoacyl synthase N-terminal-like domain-containing protein [Streptomyces albipurpureus]|uniref:Beta-ketoacyl synthase n=1 Tax=Streptomyces albipurpureus TaxID=2897419 RepID=A0ABT0UH30_9ACTN|nr:beta-ketoacyl synthase N-terminal-like domain-containing protein [Streptomyces sp. CWNU-1]MCM2387927.1 beta-ketoacyl synthase [Streptomyces sp. CWNU-1]
MSTTDILITGIGTALPGVEGPMDLVDTATPRAGTAPPVDPAALIGKRGLRYKDRASQLALCAALAALTDAGLWAKDQLTVAGPSVAVVVSSNLGNLDTVCEVAADITTEGVNGISPMGLPNASSNVIASSVAIRFGLQGPNLMVCNGATSGLDAVHWGAAMLRAGRAERALVIGVETHNGPVEWLVGRPAAELLDGAVALLLETAPAAAERGSAPIAVLGSYAREASVEACVRRLVPTHSGQPGSWFVPEGHREASPAPLAGVARTDLTERFGRASGALGVLQCATAARQLAAGGEAIEQPPVLVTSGNDHDDASAGLLLRAVGASA